VEWVDDRFPPRMLAGQTITVPITVKNAGSLTWRWGGGNPFRLGYAYYRNRKRLPMPLDRDVRTDISDDVLPGDAVVIEARIALPHDPGNYTLELDLVHEGVTWFKDQGSPVLTRWVTVEALPPAAAGESSTTTGNGAGGSGLPNLPVPLFVDVTAGLPRTGTPYARRNLGQIRYIVISHTGGNPQITLERIARAHIAAGYPGIAYDFVVDGTGQVFRVGEMENVAQPDEVWSEQGVNVALAGNFSASTPALAQIDATGRLCAWLAQNLGLGPEAIVGLGELSKSDNPGPLFYRGPTWKQMIVRQVQLHLAALGMGAVDAVRLQQAMAEAQDLSEANRTLTEQLDKATTELESLQVTSRQLQDVVADLQKQLDLQAQTGARQPPIRNVVAQLPRDRLRYRQRRPEEIRYVVINHTGAAPETPLAALAEVHRREWPGLLYDFVIDAQGAILQAQPLEEVVATNEPYLRNAVTVAFAGDFNGAVPAREQIDAGGRLIAWLMERFPHLTPDSVWGLSELTRSPSPGRQWSEGAKWKQHLLASVRRAAGLIESSALEAQLRARVAELEGQFGQAQRTAAALQEVRLRLEAETRRLEGELATRTVAQTAYVVPRPPMRNIAEQLPRHPTLRYERRALSAITHVAVHHTAAPPTLGPVRIAELHIQADPARGKDAWPGIGYHFFIHADGAIEQTNPLETVAFHVYRHNAYTVGVVFAGSFMNGKIPTSAQLRSGAHLIAWLMQEHDVPLARVWGHREFPENVTVCPGSEWQQGNRWRDLLFERVQQVTEGSGVKSIRHYMLFWQRPYPGPMARLELSGALPYITRFRPTVGFSLEDARNAEFVTIVGSEAAINAQVERALEEFGCRVERVAGRDDEETGRILADMAEKGRRFVKFDVDF
jgi:N-acetyl-anhydromuramyl-L-alanine amidase AmpD